MSRIDPDGGKSNYVDAPVPERTDGINCDRDRKNQVEEYLDMVNRKSSGGDGGNYECSGVNALELGKAYEDMGFSKNTAELFVLQNTGVDIRSNIAWNLSHD